jgi:hypothetical protein
MYPSSCTAASIFYRSLSETCSGVRNARDTVMVPTPASCATSEIVTLPVLRRFRVKDILIPDDRRDFLLILRFTLIEYTP